MLHRLFGILLIVASFLIGWLWTEYKQFTQTQLNTPETGIYYTLKPGTSMRALSEQLQQQGVIANALFLRLLARYTDQASRLQAGEYLIQAGTTPIQLLEQFVAGRVTSYSMTLVEGWDFGQILEATARHEALVHTLEGLSPAEIMARLGYPDEHPEGRFFPDTYHFPRGTSDTAFLQRAYRAMQARLTEEWSRRQERLPLQTPYDALILASIVEKETGVAHERAQIAGVFIRRLEKRMKLQTDPTVIYGMGTAFKGNIRRRDLKADTPYNTYVHAGLPPTPICMPGGDAIHAVLHPANGGSLYFVARGDASHHFSSTLKEHNRAVRKYQLKR